jgi:hypothetical protein
MRMMIDAGADAQKNQPDERQVEETPSARVSLENDFVQTRTAASGRAFRRWDSFLLPSIHSPFITIFRSRVDLMLRANVADNDSGSYPK